MSLRTFSPRRLFSRLVAAAALIIASPVLALAGLAIKLSSRGPVIYRAARVGRAGRPFTMYKLRTMHDRGSESVPISAGRDARVFPMGRWLRRFKLDELPQLANVVRGDMAIVGPRPEAVPIVHNHYTPFMRQTLDVLPGLTSPGSLSYFADEAQLPTDPKAALRRYIDELLPHKIALDLVYVRNRSLRYDVELVVRTLGSVVGAHEMFRHHVEWERAEAARLLASSEGVA